MCKILGVKANNYYYYKKNGVISESKKQQEDTALCDVIKKEFINARSHSGARRLKAKLLQGGLVVSRKRITKLMKKGGLKVKTKRKFRPQTPDSKHVQITAENLLNREFNATKAKPEVCRRYNLYTDDNRLFIFSRCYRSILKKSSRLVFKVKYENNLSKRRANSGY